MRLHKLSQKTPVFLPEVQVLPVQVPVGGWDAISPLSSMQPQYAVILDNWVPRTGWVELRQGFTEQSDTGTNSPVETVLVYRPMDAPQKMIAASAGKLFDVSSAGSAPQLATGFGSNRWQSVNFKPGGNNISFMLMVNGVDPYTVYDGTTFTPETTSITVDPSSFPTSINTSTWVQVSQWKRRAWFVEENSTRAWFLPTDAITGVATPLDMGPFFSLGGFLQAVGNWTIDGGDGPDDYIAFLSDQGELALFQGTDPTNAASFAIVGVFRVPNPIGRRCFYKFGSDLYLISQQGIIPISKALPYDPSGARSVALTERIQNAMLQSAQQFGDNFGWQMMSFPAQGLFLLNIPLAENSSSVQYVMNVLTGAWCQFKGWNANAFEIFNNALYFGDNFGAVQNAFNGLSDGDQPIFLDMKCAFNFFGDPGRIKRATMVQPFLLTSGGITPSFSIDVDFGDSFPSTPISTLDPPGAMYDVDEYDVGVYSAGTLTQTLWFSAEGEGRALALRMQLNVLPSFTPDGSSASPVLQLNMFNLQMELGAVV